MKEYTDPYTGDGYTALDATPVHGLCRECATIGDFVWSVWTDTPLVHLTRLARHFAQLGAWTDGDVIFGLEEDKDVAVARMRHTIRLVTRYATVPVEPDETEAAALGDVAYADWLEARGDYTLAALVRPVFSEEIPSGPA